jgi:hypothetical protein
MGCAGWFFDARGLCGLVAGARIGCRRGRCHAFERGVDGWARGGFINVNDMYNNDVGKGGGYVPMKLMK